MGLFSSLFGGFFNDMGGLLASFNKPLLEQQYRYSRESRQTAYQDTMQSAREAGLNPLLAVSNGAISGQNFSSNATPADLGNGITSGIATALQVRQQANQNKLNNAQIRNLDAKTETEETVRRLNIANSLNKEADTILKSKDASWFDKRMAISLKNDSLRAKAALGQASAAQTNADIQKYLASSAKEKNEAEAAFNRERNRGYTTKVGPFSHTGNSLFSNINPYQNGEWIEETDEKGRKYYVFNKY